MSDVELTEAERDDLCICGELATMNPDATDEQMMLLCDAQRAMVEAILAARLSQEREQRDKAVRDLTEAIRLTVEYVGLDALRPVEGWSWYDALVKYAPDVAAAFLAQDGPRPAQEGEL